MFDSLGCSLCSNPRAKELLAADYTVYTEVNYSEEASL